MRRAIEGALASLKAVWIMVILGLVRLLEPIVMIRFGTLFVSRLGHLAGNTECYLCERDAKGLKSFDICCPVGEPANAYLLKMFSRVIHIWHWTTIVNEVGKRWKWWEKHTFSDAQWGRDIHHLMESSPPHLRFTKAEERRGQRALCELGIPESAKWVCIIGRDSLYLKVKEPWADYSYHDFRDSDINNYRAAAVALMEHGYWVIRMGVHVDARMKLQAPQFIDYAVSGTRTEFMDIYLGAKCEFCISNSTGFDGIPMIFRRPILYVNEGPLGYLSTWMADSLAIWKHHWRNGARMGVAEIFKSGAGMFTKASEYAQAGIRLEENTPEEIRDAALEMLKLGHESQEWFWRNYPRVVSPHNGLPLHGKIRLRIGQQFLDSYKN